MTETAEKGCLVIHGLTGTPATMKPVIDELITAGFLVNAPLLPGHGTREEDLLNISWEMWWSAVLDAYHDLKRVAAKVSCVGLSLGSLLALKLAVEMKWGVRAVAAMGTPLVLGNFIEYFAHPVVKYSPLRWIYKYSKKNWKESVADPEGRDYYKRHSYEMLPVRSVLEIFKLKEIVAKSLKEITPPVFVIHGKEDRVAPLKNLDILKKSLNSNMVDFLVCGRSRHVVSLDYDKENVAKAIVAFLNKFS